MPKPENAYPLPRPTDGTGRITRQLIADVAGVLLQHGLPQGTSVADLDRLQRALDRFVYGAHDEPAVRGDVSVTMHHAVVERGASVTGLVINGPL